MLNILFQADVFLIQRRFKKWTNSSPSRKFLHTYKLCVCSGPAHILYVVLLSNIKF